MGRQWTALALAGALAVTLTACGADNTAENNNNGMTGQTGYARTGRAGYSNSQRRTNDYMQDARYRAGSGGQVNGRDSSMTRDLTQDARDMIRGAEDAVKDAGNGIRNATKDIMNQ